MNPVYIIRILVFAGIVSFFYWEVVHRIFIRALRFRLFELRDDARRMASEKALGGSKEFKALETFICLTIAYIPNISLLSFLISKTPTISGSDAEALAAFEREAPPEFLDVRNSACKCAIIMMTLNSPWLIFGALFPVLSLWVLGKISGAIIYRKTESFVEGLSPAPAITLPSAMIA